MRQQVFLPYVGARGHGLLVLAFVGALFAEGGTRHAVLQAQGAAPTADLRLTVRPHEMKIGTHNEAGEHVLPNGQHIYVPASVAGKQRAPLIVLIDGRIDRWTPMADKYGTIFISLDKSYWDATGKKIDDVRDIDETLKLALSTYAIDPDRIAVMGLSNGGSLAAILGCANLDVFSRMGLMSAIPTEWPSCQDTRPQSKRTQVYLTVGTGEAGSIASVLAMVPKVRQDGHPFKLVLDLRVHQNRRQDYGNLWAWFADSWRTPRTTIPSPLVATDTVVRLTPEIFRKLTTFWEPFSKAHPIDYGDGDTWPVQNQQHVATSVGMEHMTVSGMVDLHAVAKTDSLVARWLKQAGLTFAQEEAYRAALIGAYATYRARYHPQQTTATTPAVERNIALLGIDPRSVSVKDSTATLVQGNVSYQVSYPRDFLHKDIRALLTMMGVP